MKLQLLGDGMLANFLGTIRMCIVITIAELEIMLNFSKLSFG